MKLFLLLLMMSNAAWPQANPHDLQVAVKREGRVYDYSASFDTPLSKCQAYGYLTDYEAKKALPGVVSISVQRKSAETARVELTADEPVLFFSVRINSVMEYTEKPFQSVSFVQSSGNSIIFQGRWNIEPGKNGSTLSYKGLWEPDTVIPLIILDQFAVDILTSKFSAIAELAAKYRGGRRLACADQ